METRAWVKQLVGSALAVPNADVLDSVLDGSEFDRFLNDGTQQLLLIAFDEKVFLDENRNARLLSDLDSIPSAAARCVALGRTQPVALTPENISDILQVTGLSDSPTNALYRSIHAIFAPIFLNSRWSIDARLQNLISELDYGLASAVRKGATNSVHGADESDFKHIHTLDDEFLYWVDLAADSTLGKAQRSRAESFKQLLQPLKVEFDKMSSTALSDTGELVEQAQDVLDELWRQMDHASYREDRMVHLLEVTTEQIISKIRGDLAQARVLTNLDTKVKDDLKESLVILGAWKSAHFNLTGRLWPHNTSNKWNGPAYESDQLSLFSTRLREIQDIRGTHELLSQLLTDDEQKGLREALATLEKAHPLNVNTYAQSAWQNAVLVFTKALSPVEHRAATALRALFAGLQGSPGQLLREFQRYADLLKRDTISRELASEKESLVRQLINQLQGVEASFKERQINAKEPKGRNVPNFLRRLTWTRQAIIKIEEHTAFMEEGIDGRSAYRDASQSLHDSLRKYEQELFADWLADVEVAMSDREGFLAPDRGGKMMEIEESNGKLRVHYSDQTLTLIKEVRQLLSMGFAVPTQVQQIAENAQKYYRHGVVLKQVAQFYNTIEQQMLPSQQAMLLDSALAFERLIKSPTGDAGAVISERKGSWNPPSQLEGYITQIQLAADKLTLMNRRLRKLHSAVCDQVIGLMGVDLVRGQSKWKDALSNIRTMIASVQEHGIRMQDTLTWRNHWDYQLYKALEYQYKVGLENLHVYLPEIKIDLQYKQARMQFRPPFEDVRAKYYREMKKFINVPATFKGLSDNQIFKHMIDSNASALVSVYQRADKLFENLAKVEDIFKDWVILGTVDLDQFVEDVLLDVPDYEENFRVIKLKGKESEVLPTEVKVDCITISTLPIKSAIDDHLQRMFDAMVSGLRKAVLRHMAVIDEFTTKGSETLSQRPQTLAEIGQANTRHEELAASQAEIRSNFESADAKNRLLKAVSGSGIDVSGIQARWNKLEIMLESHDIMIKEQVDLLRTQIDGRCQAFVTDVTKFTQRWQQLKPSFTDASAFDTAPQNLAFVKDRSTELAEMQKTAEKIKSDSAHFGVEAPEFPELEVLVTDIHATEQMWQTYTNYVGEMDVLRKEDWIGFRNKIHTFEDTLVKWIEFFKGKPGNPVSAQILRDVDKHRETIPVLKFLRGDSWTTEHWAELFRMLALPRGTTLSELTFGHILAAQGMVLEKINEIKELNSRAQGEISIREAIQELDMWGASASFSLTDYQDVKGNNVQLIKDWKDLLTQVGDNQSLLSSLKDSPYYKAFADRAILWEKKLFQLEANLSNLNSVQRRWVYLEPIFNRGSLPNEQQRFERIDAEFRAIMVNVARDSRVVSLLSHMSGNDVLSTLVDQLDRCQKALNEFLEQKREKFPRFYFIGDEDLLEILGQAKNPIVIQAHLKKLFAGVHSVQFDEDIRNIVAMKSIDGETVMLRTPVKITDDVEIWLEDFAKEMKVTLKHLLKQCVSITDLFKYPLQILSLTEHLHFTANVETAIANGGSFTQLAHDLRQHLNEYTTFDPASVENVADRNVAELKIKSLILDVIHFSDIVAQLQEAGLKTVSDWTWQRQLRFYFNPDDECVMKMNDAEFLYTYEYQGIPPKLVHTPLTDKCYLTLTQGMASGFGGNPFGPAGTGKTESVKALGVLFGRQVLVFNCDEGIDYKSMGRIFVGLVKCGAWGCFDEFNRLEEAVLSAVSQQIQTIQAALKSKAASVDLLGRVVNLDQNSGIFVTLNPAGKGYGGRQKLPDNLKQLFRSIAMTHPDNELISEVILFSEGFQRGKDLGAKVVSVFVLCKQLLSQQQHYDWGLRPLKAVLGLAGRLLHAEKRSGTIDPERERCVVVKALRVNTLSKLTFADSLRFEGVMSDIFPDVNIEEVDYRDLAVAVKAAYAELNLIYIESQAEKIYQFYQACKQRMGVVLVGPSGSGKSTLWRVLRLAWQKVGQSLRYHVFNPKAIERNRLLGHMDMDTREWFDGVLTSASRQAVKEPTNVHTWVISDGDIDPEWVESLNSVLDDNRLLTMPSGERIQFGPNVNFIFETHNLTFASPATVSRMGMIYLSDETLDIRALVQGWILKQHEDARAQLSQWVDAYFYRSIDWVLSNAKLVTDTSKVGLVMNGLSQLGSTRTHIQFLYSLIRGLGANVQIEDRLKFANELLRWANEESQDPKRTLDYFVNDNGSLDQYSLQEQTDIKVDIEDLENIPLVLTPDIRKAFDTVMPWIVDNQPVLLVGPEGAGKHMLLRHCFSSLKSTAIAMIHCSAQTKSSHVLQRLKQTCTAAQTSAGRVLRPRDADRLIIYLKDINLPKPDKYATVELIQFLQQLLTYQGFYDSNLEWIGIEHIQIVASMNPSATMGRHDLSTRFTSVIRQSFITYTDRDQLQSVYRLLLQPVLANAFPGHKVWTLPRNVQKLAATMLSVYDFLRQHYTPDVKPHYLFTPRDLTRWTMGIRRYELVHSEQDELLNIIAYEARRLFQDRLVGSSTKTRFADSLNGIIRNEWNHEVDIESKIYTAALSTASRINLHGRRGLTEVSKQDFIKNILDALKIFERDNRDLNLSLIPETVEQIALTEWALGQPGGSLLLAGRPGVGRLQAVLIVNHMLKHKFWSPSVGRGYSMKEFSNDLKQILQATGVNGEETVLVMEDHHLQDASILESLNSLLSGGEVPGLYAQDELDAVLGSLKNQHSEEGYRGSLFEFFVTRIRRNLHVVLLMDSASPDFVQHCESNPAFYTRSQIGWVETWAPRSMFEFAKAGFERSDVLAKLADKEKLIKMIIQLFSEYKSKGINPRHFSNYMTVYEQIFRQRQASFDHKKKYLSGGLKKLNEAAKYVDKLSADAKKRGEELAEKQREADVALKQITDSMVNASEQKKEMEQLTIKLKEEEEKMVKRKAAIEQELAEVEPLVTASKAAVGDIRSDSLSEIRSLRAPPPAIRDVLEGVLRMMGILDMSWNSMKSFLGKRTVKEEIMNFDARSINKQVRVSVGELLKEKRDSFEEATIKRVSVAAAPLAAWVKANLQYSAILEKIQPLETDLNRLTKSLDTSRERVDKLRGELAIVDSRVAELKAGFSSKTRDAEVLRAGLEKAEFTIKAAQGLLKKLSGEGKRWAIQVQEINESLRTLAMNTLLASACVTYLGGATEDERSRTISEWQKIVDIPNFSFKEAMTTESEQLIWKSEGLPADVLSVENAAIIINCNTTPLIVDPSGQAAAWLKTHLAERKPEIVNQHDDNFIRSLELGIRFGKTLVVQEVTDIEPLLFPLLRKDLQKQGPRSVLQMGDKTIDYNDAFRLYLVTRRADFVIPTYAEGYIQDINFTVTRAGLAGQLLGVTLKHEKPELEIEKMKLLKNEEELKIQLARLEESLLSELANSQGNILENKTLIDSLNETQQKSSVIANGLQESRRLQEALDRERDKFAPLSSFGSLLFFAMADLARLNNMYRFSLSSFLRLYSQALGAESSATNDGTELRVQLLMSILEKSSYNYISRSIFKADRHGFALHLVHSLHPELFDKNEWELLTGSIVSVEETHVDEVPGWVPAERAVAWTQLETSLPSLVQRLQKTDSSLWTRWLKHPKCELEGPVPKLSGIQRVLLVQALRPDRLLSAMTSFCCGVMGLPTLAPAAMNLAKMSGEESIPTEPILFITTAGADPSDELRELAVKEVGESKYHQVAMGQGQGDTALSMLRDGMRSGGWVCLQNVHLVTSWLPILEKEIASSKPHEKFRLWLTSEAHANFPSSLLQNCLKITVEAPPGVKNNLLRTYEAWTPAFIADGPVHRAQALFGLAWFHAVIQERRTYIPQGWNKFYEFSAADLRSSAELISKMCSNAKAPQWQVLHGLLENAIYGGKIDEPHDALKLRTYLKEYFNDDVFTIAGKAPTKRLGKGLSLPNVTDHTAYQSLIGDLPDIDDVTSFGLPGNIDRILQRNTSQIVITQLKALRRVDSHGQQFDKDVWTKELGPFLQLWRKLHSGQQLLQKKVQQDPKASPTESFFALELTNAITLLLRIDADFRAITKVIKGTMLLTNDVISVAHALIRGETPQSWIAKWDGGPEIPQQFLKEAVSNTISVESSLQKASTGTLFTQPLSLAKLFNPVTFLNALRQHTSRQLKIPMDTLKLTTSWDSKQLSTSTAMISVDGLFLQGASFNGTRLSEAHAEDPTFVQVPLCNIAWVPKDRAEGTRGIIQTPLYTSPTREKLVCNVGLPCETTGAEAWILAGVALFLKAD
ncbi:dynein heavy chain and region D6 of dynein motor-domain-containing protein [Fimicolochytrium jonesii]|uniref:dynein heavy chain and region D6 of dynein motor-domain-containing protein n=1 Tax=Fimicolochytrium jonesii TaxID=1396493 RepID=UPI0022FEFCC2|nr:dynein heavy chain and region D6 of dynein motor-domain-containing protein [Fimicolochytrium jonesii]KAI8824969.1 dynein heavy chain and region D6 of dynein motor-domain-containing protein [Fimicolochytrium jonesii]